jgi:hypothetical protein
MDHLLSTEISAGHWPAVSNRLKYMQSLFSFESTFSQKIIDSLSGDDGGGDTLVPIPNTTVKPSSANGTCSEGSRESRTSPGRGIKTPFVVP